MRPNFQKLKKNWQFVDIFNLNKKTYLTNFKHLGNLVFGSSLGKNGSPLGIAMGEQVRLSESQALQSFKEPSWSDHLILLFYCKTNDLEFK